MNKWCGAVGICILWKQDETCISKGESLIDTSGALIDKSSRLIDESAGLMLRRKSALEKNFEDFDRHLVVLGYLNILYEVFFNRKLLYQSDIEELIRWANSWFDRFREPIKIAYENADLHPPLDFLVWLRDEVFGREKFEPLMGTTLESARYNLDRNANAATP